MKEGTIELYIHIPFCARKCRYCDFLSFPGGREQREAYVRALAGELAAFRGREERRVSSIFFGGGTPSLLEPGQAEEIFAGIRGSFCLTEDAEITLESNPGSLSPQKLAAWRALGVNRLSIGLQSADDRELRLLGRIHTWEDFLEGYAQAREAGFSNINVDLISAIPGQTPESWRSTLEKTVRLSPEHISAYSLIVEEGTPFYEEYGEDAARRERGDLPRFLPTEEEERQMYEETGRILAGAGYERYEISNYARPGYACRHNQGYWERRDYLGFGLGASSLYRGSRFKNLTDLEAYRKAGGGPQAYRMEEQRLTVQEEMEETMFLGLRLRKGVSEKEFSRRFGKTCREIYGPVIRRLESQGLLGEGSGRLFLTEKGIDVSNYCMAEFLLT